MSKIRFVVVGAGLIGPRHAELVLRTPQCSLFAIVDRSARGSEVAARFNALHFRTVDEMFLFCHQYRVDYPDAAVVATPNSSHASVSVQLASKGIHLLVEKPLASSPEECRSLIEFCDSRGVVLLVGHHRRFNPYIVAAKAHMAKIGTPVMVQGVWALKKCSDYFAEKPWRRSHHHGGGTLMINLIHDLDLLQYLLGPIQRVYAEVLPKQRPQEGPGNHVDEGAALTLRFVSGCCGTFVCSDNVTSPFNFEAGTGENPLIPRNNDMAGFYRLFGSRGTLSVPDFTLYHQNDVSDAEHSWLRDVHAEKLDILSCDRPVDQSRGFMTPPSSYDAKLPQFHMARELPRPFDLQVQHFVNLITGKESVSKCSGRDALSALLCIEAVRRSIETELPQVVPAAVGSQTEFLADSATDSATEFVMGPQHRDTGNEISAMEA